MTTHPQATNQPALEFEPGGTYRLIDGPAMLYLGTEEQDGMLLYTFGYWKHSCGGFTTEATPYFQASALPPEIAQYVVKLDPPST